MADGVGLFCRTKSVEEELKNLDLYVNLNSPVALDVR